MNKKIKIIELLNLIANKEEIPRHIKYEYYQYDWSDNANNYICEDADGERLSMFDDGYICILCNSLNDEVEILEDNTEEQEKLGESWKEVGKRVGELAKEFEQGFKESFTEIINYPFKNLEDNPEEIEEYKGETFEQLGYEVGKMSMAIAKGLEKAIKEMRKDLKDE